jgi:type VI secretion system protein VasD
VVALFRTPDTQMNTWRLTLTRDDLDPDRARVIELGKNRLTLQSLAEE